MSLKEGFYGFCMALADSVPGVSGGTIAFILGFYDRFIGSIDDLVFASWPQKKKALRYLLRLGFGWLIGMVLAVLVLSMLFENHIYVVSSVFFGLVLGSIPLICKEEKECLRLGNKNWIFGVIGAVLVVAISWMHGHTSMALNQLDQFDLALGIQLFLIGMVAISAMFLPGISGSTLLLIFGAYMPIIAGIRSFLSLDLSVLPALMVFGLGILFGASSVVKLIRFALEKHRSAMVYAILGMMVGSLYAIVQGPTTLDVPQAAMGLSNFHLLAALIGCFLVLALQMIKDREA